jgi:predicted glycogen debranching enzyme
MELDAEWLEADGLGGFASGTVGGVRTRRYHGVLLHAATPPTGRVLLVAGFDATLETAAGSVPLSTQAYVPGVKAPDGVRFLESFEHEPWPAWVFRLPDGTRIRHELFAVHGTSAIVLTWTRLDGSGPATLAVRPFFAGRDYHALHHENPAFRFAPAAEDGRLVWHPYDGVPAIVTQANGGFSAEPLWYRRFEYAEERARGLDASEDLAAPGVYRFDLDGCEATWTVAAEPHGAVVPAAPDALPAWLAERRRDERTRRAAFPTPLHRAAGAYVVRRGRGRTLVAGYPWFTDWGRDTFVALRGLCLASRRLDVARDILLEWAGHVSEGMLPNRFPDHGEAPEFNSVDASLWYVVAVHELLERSRTAGIVLAAADVRALTAAADAILAGYARGTRHGIRMDTDGMLSAGEPGVQLTWMDAKVGDWVVTPRVGKPVEVQALWLNALALSATRDPRWADAFARGAASFEARFWNEEAGCLYDVVDVDHRRGVDDPAVRPNQVLAVGGLPRRLLTLNRARRVVDAVEARLWTPLGLRSLAPGEPGYQGHYQGGVRERDGAYHQGTVWPWLAGPFVEAWVRVRGGTADAVRAARERFLPPLVAHLTNAGLGHVSEIADAEAPHVPRGCPFQAWSVGELLRLRDDVLAEGARPERRSRACA